MHIISQERGPDAELEARIQTYELAFRMQSAAPEAVDLASESAETKRLYGLDEARTAEFGTRCLLARRLVERGVRFVQLYSGDVNGWDAHDNVEANHATMCGRTDKPVAGLLKDLKRRGLLESTLVIWGGEFGRMPMSESGKGRDHNPHGFCYWMAGGGVKGGTVHGATDAVGPARGGRSRARARPARHDPAPARARSQAAHVPSQRPRRPPDRHGRRGHPLDPRLTLHANMHRSTTSLIHALPVFALWRHRWLSFDRRRPDHWAFIPPRRSAVPRVDEASWVRNPIDAFILARLEERGLPHAPEADRATLLRRLSFDLTGLPPTPDELDAFLADRSPLAYERLVDRLLTSPHYGERWGQHWLDLARFAETDGFEFDQARPERLALSRLGGAGAQPRPAL